MGTSQPRLRFPSPALILSCLALFAAIGGGAYAAGSIGSSSIHFTNATLKNGWKGFDNQSAPAGYAKDSVGMVHLRGAIANGQIQKAAFVLPKALRPSHVITPIVDSGSVPIVAILRIQPDGKVIPIGGAVTTFTGLDGVSFAAGE